MLMQEKEQIIKLLRSFHQLTGMRVGVFSKDRKELYAYPNKMGQFCTLFRKNPDADKQCVMCDHAAFDAARKTEEIIIYRCPGGLTEACLPIICQGEFLGYMMMGQFRTEQSSQAYSGALGEAFEAIQCKSAADVEAAAILLHTCANYVYLLEWMRRRQSSPIQQVRAYIELHMEEAVTIASLAHGVGMSRTALYVCVKEQLGMTVFDLIETIKMEHAKYLLWKEQKTVTETARLCGYRDPAYFSKRFRKKFGISPSKYV